MEKRRVNRKVAHGGTGGALSILIMYVLRQVGLDVPAEVAVAITSLLTFTVQYFVKEEKGKKGDGNPASLLTLPFLLATASWVWLASFITRG